MISVFKNKQKYEYWHVNPSPHPYGLETDCAVCGEEVRSGQVHRLKIVMKLVAGNCLTRVEYRKSFAQAFRALFCLAALLLIASCGSEPLPPVPTQPKQCICPQTADDWKIFCDQHFPDHQLGNYQDCLDHGENNFLICRLARDSDCGSPE
jgi:hypothetical protein